MIRQTPCVHNLRTDQRLCPITGQICLFLTLFQSGVDVQIAKHRDMCYLRPSQCELEQSQLAKRPLMTKQHTSMLSHVMYHDATTRNYALCLATGCFVSVLCTLYTLFLYVVHSFLYICTRCISSPSALHPVGPHVRRKGLLYGYVRMKRVVSTLFCQKIMP